jgi:transcriptional regulator with XRE-family HTH domain
MHFRMLNIETTKHPQIMKKKEPRVRRDGTIAHFFNQLHPAGDHKDSPPERHVFQPDASTVPIETNYFSTCEPLASPSDWMMGHTTILVEPAKKAPYFSVLGEAKIIPLEGNIEIETLRSTGARVYSHRSPIEAPTIIQATVPHRLIGSKDSVALMVYEHSLPTLRSFLQKERFAFRTMNDHALYPMVAWGIAETIRHFRRKTNMEIFELADLIGVDRAQVSRIESAGTNVGMNRLRLIADALAFDSQCLLGTLWYQKQADADLVLKTTNSPITLSDRKDGTIIPFDSGVFVEFKTDGSESGKPYWVQPMKPCHFRRCSKVVITPHEKDTRILIA